MSVLWKSALCFILIIYRTEASKGQENKTMPIFKHPHDMPQFLEPIKNVTVAIGREAVLSCSVTDLGHYKVGWMKADDQTILSLHTRVITHNPRITVTHDDTLKTWQLRIRQLKESDRGCYMCQINTGEMKKQLGCVDVQVPPDIDDTGTSGDITVSEGDNVTLTCSATGHPEPKIVWRKENGEYIFLNSSPREVKKVDTHNNPSLNMISVERKQMGAYLCIASNDVPPAVSKRITLNINYAPRVQVVQKGTIGAPLESNVKLRCEVEAFPNSNNFWMKESEVLRQSSNKYSMQEKKSGLKIIMILTIFNITKNDMGVYVCTASNFIGKSEDSITLYEIKLSTTTSTTTTTTTTTSTTTTTTETNLVLEITSSIRSTTAPLFPDNFGAKIMDSDPSENWLFPSMGPAPLELETLSRASAVLHLNGALFAFSVFFIFR